MSGEVSLYRRPVSVKSLTCVTVMIKMILCCRFLLDQRCASLKSNDACLFVSRGAAFVERRKLAARQASRSSLEDPWRQQEEERVVEDQEFLRRRMLAPRHVVVAANGRQCEVKQEEEFNDDGFVVGLSFIDHEGPRHCAISGRLSVMFGRQTVERTHLNLQDCKKVSVGISNSVESLDITSVQEQGDWESRRMQEGRSWSRGTTSSRKRRFLRDST